MNGVVETIRKANDFDSATAIIYQMAEEWEIKFTNDQKQTINEVGCISIAYKENHEMCFEVRSTDDIE